MLIMTTSNKKWTVFRRGESLGTYTAAEIREELRKGVLSPNDFAAAEESVVQQEIIEIDEIFWTGGTTGTPQFGDTNSKSRPGRSRLKENLDSIPVTRPKDVKLYPVVGRENNRRQRRRHGPLAVGSDTGASTGRNTSNIAVILLGALFALAVAGLAYIIQMRTPGP